MVPSDYLTIDQAAEYVQAHPNSVRMWWEHGLFPEPVRFGQRCLRWRRADIDLWGIRRDVEPEKYAPGDGGGATRGEKDPSPGFPEAT